MAKQKYKRLGPDGRLAEAVAPFGALAAIERQAQVAGFQALDVRNFASAAFKRFGEEVGSIGSESWKEAKAAISRGVGRGVEEGVAASVKVGIVALISAFAGPLAGMATFVYSFAPLGRRAKEVKSEIEADGEQE